MKNINHNKSFKTIYLVDSNYEMKRDYGEPKSKWKVRLATVSAVSASILLALVSTVSGVMFRPFF